MTNSHTASPIRVSFKMGLWAPSPGHFESIFILEAVNIAPRTVVKHLNISVELNQQKFSIYDTSQMSISHSEKLPKALERGDTCTCHQRQSQIARALTGEGVPMDSKVSLRAFCADTLGGEYYSDAIVISPREMMSE